MLAIRQRVLQRSQFRHLAACLARDPRPERHDEARLFGRGNRFGRLDQVPPPLGMAPPDQRFEARRDGPCAGPRWLVVEYKVFAGG